MHIGFDLWPKQYGRCVVSNNAEQWLVTITGGIQISACTARGTVGVAELKVILRINHRSLREAHWTPTAH